MDSVERFQKDVEYKIDKHATRLGLSKAITAQAKSLYDMFNGENIAYTRPDDVFAIASLYLAHKVLEDNSDPTSASELIEGTDISEKHVIRAYKSMQTKLVKEYNIQINVFEPDQFIDKYVRQLGISEQVADKAKSILSDTQEVMRNKANSTKAAASLYLACQLEGSDVTQKAISDVSGVTEVTIRHRYQQQKESMELTA